MNTTSITQNTQVFFFKYIFLIILYVNYLRLAY